MSKTLTLSDNSQESPHSVWDQPQNHHLPISELVLICLAFGDAVYQPPSTTVHSLEREPFQTMHSGTAQFYVLRTL